ncbi:MAG: AP2 domain-containing protein [Candidatus Latescibacterota bacterium]
MTIIRAGRSSPGYFADATYGGRRAALVAAQRYRDELLLCRVPPDTRIPRWPPKNKRHTTGVLGVSRETYRVNGRAYQRYVATWPDPEHGTQRRRFAVRRYGRRRARELAIAARQAGVAHACAVFLARQRAEAALRLKHAPPPPEQVKDPRARRGIRMPPRRKKGLG